jgi:hypothetical protein
LRKGKRHASNAPASLVWQRHRLPVRGCALPGRSARRCSPPTARPIENVNIDTLIAWPRDGHQFTPTRSVVKSVKIKTKVTLKLSKREFGLLIIIVMALLRAARWLLEQ